MMLDVKSVSPKTEALRRPMIRLCQALMLILAASVCSAQVVVTNTFRINLTMDGYLAGTFTEITGVDPQLNQTSSTSQTTTSPTKGRLVLRRRVNNDLWVSGWYTSGSRRSLTLTIYDGGIPVTKLWLENTVPISMSYSTEPDGGRMVLVETVVLDYTALQRLSV